MKKNDKSPLDKKLKILKRLNWGNDIKIGRGATINLENSSPVLIDFLRLKYLENSNLMIGDIEFLFRFPGKGYYPEDEMPFGDIKYRGE